MNFPAVLLRQFQAQHRLHQMAHRLQRRLFLCHRLHRPWHLVRQSVLLVQCHLLPLWSSHQVIAHLRHIQFSNLLLALRLPLHLNHMQFQKLSLHPTPARLHPLRILLLLLLLILPSYLNPVVQLQRPRPAMN